ncbi:hypothetical protein D3C83_210470 [compost metagenome]
MFEDETRLEEHADRREEQGREKISERPQDSADLVNEIGIADDHARSESAQRR